MTNSRAISDIIETLDPTSWNDGDLSSMRGRAVDALENGKVLYLPRLAFTLLPSELSFLSPAIVGAGTKNVSFNRKTGELKGAVGSNAELAAVGAMLRRYCEQSCSLVRDLLPRYAEALDIGRTSFRPVEVEGRALSARKDDSRLHIDAFPSTPMGERRILRVFTNLNLSGRGRHWRIGAQFEDVAKEFVPKVRNRAPGSAWLMNAIGVTKGRRTRYDHMMLGVHDAMKLDEDYQRRAVQNEFDFAPGSTWVVFTDVTSHAAMGGQHLLEQTFYLPVSAMKDVAKSPQRMLERIAARA